MHTRTTKKRKTAESYKKAKEKSTSSSSFTSNICQKVDNKLKNIISYRIIIRYVVHKTTDSNKLSTRRAPPSRRNVAVLSHVKYVPMLTPAAALRVMAALSKAAW